MIDVTELQKQFSVQNVDPYGECIIVPHKSFRREWEKDLASQGFKVFSNVYEGQIAFFIRLMKGKSKDASLQNGVVTRNATVLSSQQHEGKFVRVPIALLESSPSAPREVYEDIETLAARVLKRFKNSS